MLHIGAPYLQNEAQQTRLCAEISLNGHNITLWFGVVPDQAAYLCPQRSDAFVMALLPAAMREKQDISCETPMSERLHYQLEHYLIPTLASAGTLYHPISIHGPLTGERLPNLCGVGTAFPGRSDSPYPLTHLTCFNMGLYAEADFRNACDDTQKLAREMGLTPVALDSNLQEMLPEPFSEVSTFRDLAGLLALQGLFSVYLYRSQRAISGFALDLSHCAAFDLLTTNCGQTESLCIYLSGDADMEDRP